MAKRQKFCEECKGYPLFEIPLDVYDIIIDKQVKEKKKRDRIKKPIDRVIYTIIREWKLLTKAEPIVVINDNDDFIVTREVNPIERSHIFNAINIKTKK